VLRHARRAAKGDKEMTRTALVIAIVLTFVLGNSVATDDLATRAACRWPTDGMLATLTAAGHSIDLTSC